MSFQYADKLRDGLLVNANAGGENVHRGELFGLVLGLNNGDVKSISDFVGQLKDGVAIKNEIEAFVGAVTSGPISVDNTNSTSDEMGSSGKANAKH